MSTKNFEGAFKSYLTEGLNHLGEREYMTYTGWKLALKKKYPNQQIKIDGDRDIASALINGVGIGEWDGAAGSIYNLTPELIAKMQGAVTAPVVENTQPVVPSDSGGDAEAWKKSLGPDTDPTAFDAASNPQPAISQQNIEIAKQWVQRIEDFKKFINGLEPDSLAVQLNKMDRDGSVFRGIVKSESKRLIKIAEALGGFNEILRSYIIGSEKKARELQAQTSKAQ
jgi:hypothetical protein